MKREKLLFVSLFLFSLFFGCKEEEDKIHLTPDVDFTFSPEEPMAGEEVPFTAGPVLGSSEISFYFWDFGDVTGSTAYGKTTNFAYEEEGTYKITLTATDVDGVAVDVIKEITVVPDPGFPAAIAWAYSNETPVERVNDGSSSPAIGDDGTIYYLESFARANSKMVAITDEGETALKKWDYTFGNNVRNAPAIGPDGNIYITSWDGYISSLNPQEGALAWSQDLTGGASNSTAAIDSKGNVYHGSRGSPTTGIFSWAPDGTKRWEITGIGSFYTSPAISKDESTLYGLNSSSGEIWAVNTADGALKWDIPLVLPSKGTGTSLSIDSDGTVYATTGAHVVAITDEGTSGSVKWSYAVDGAANSGVVIGPEGDLYVGSGIGLLSLNPANGSLNWKFESVIGESVPAVDVNGNIYFGTTDGELTIVNPDGEILISFQLGDSDVNSPTIDDDGTVYVEAFENSKIKICKITVENSGPAVSPWPMKGQNKKNTGLAL